MRHKLLHGFTSLILALVISIAGIIPALAAPPINDNFADAEIIASLPFSATVDLTEGTIEPNEPLYLCSYPEKTVWYSYTATESKSISINMQGSAISGFVGLYRSGTPGINGLIIQRCGSTNSPIDIYRVEAGQTYYLQVGSLNGETGNLQINLQEIPSPSNDDFANAENIISLPFNTTVDISGAGGESGELQPCGVNMEGTIWYSFSPPETMTIRADIRGSLSSANLNVYRSYGLGISDQEFLGCTVNSYSNSITFLVEAGQTYYIQAGIIGQGGGIIQVNLQQLLPPANDNFTNAEVITSLPFSSITDVTVATNETGESQPCYYFMERTIWYSFTPTENTGVRVNTQGTSLNHNVNIYKANGPGISDLSFLNCAVENNSFSFVAKAGQTYYLQAGSVFGAVGSIQINLEQFPTPANDNFSNATVIPSPLPFDDAFDISLASAQAGEPTPSCAGSGVNGTVWYAYTPNENGSLSASVSAPFFTYTLLTVYSGSSLANLTELGCRGPYGGVITFPVAAGTTYYFQAGNYFSNQGNSIQFHLEKTPPPQASFYYYPGDPSKYDTVQFQDNSYDPGQIGFQIYTWDFGDGTTANGYSATHKYLADGDYQVTHTVTTVDGRTATTTQTVQVRTHDVAITKITTPASANVGQAKTITVTLRNIAYPETVQIDLYKSTPNGFVWVATITKAVPALSGKRTTAVNFSYTFTSDDAKLGKVTFKAIATLVGARDAYPADNEAISSITKVAK